MKRAFLLLLATSPKEEIPLLYSRLRLTFYPHLSSQIKSPHFFIFYFWVRRSPLILWNMVANFFMPTLFVARLTNYSWLSQISHSCVKLHLATSYYSWLRILTLNRHELQPTAHYYFWPRLITVGRLILHLAAYNYTWPPNITPNRVLLLLAAYYYTWPPQITSNHMLLLMDAYSYSWSPRITLGRV